jgi:hypothetical protein
MVTHQNWIRNERAFYDLGYTPKLELKELFINHGYTSKLVMK